MGEMTLKTAKTRLDALSDMDIEHLVPIAGAVAARKKELNDLLKEVNKELNELNFYILKKMNERDQTQGKYGNIAVSVSSQIQPQPNPEKWEEIYQWAVDNGRTDMLMKRVNAAPFREALESPFSSASTNLIAIICVFSAFFEI